MKQVHILSLYLHRPKIKLCRMTNVALTQRWDRRRRTGLPLTDVAACCRSARPEWFNSLIKWSESCYSKGQIAGFTCFAFGFGGSSSSKIGSSLIFLTVLIERRAGVQSAPTFRRNPIDCGREIEWKALTARRGHNNNKIRKADIAVLLFMSCTKKTTYFPSLCHKMVKSESTDQVFRDSDLDVMNFCL